MLKPPCLLLPPCTRRVGEEMAVGGSAMGPTLGQRWGRTKVAAGPTWGG